MGIECGTRSIQHPSVRYQMTTTAGGDPGTDPEEELERQAFRSRDL